MYHINLITIGRSKNGSIKTLADEYLKRLSPYARVDIKEIKEEPFNSENDRSKVLRIEGERITENLPSDSFNILLSEHGQTFTSTDFSSWLEKHGESGARHLTFVIAGPLGVDPELQKNFDATLSLSPLTFPHDLARLVLLEQVYRAMTIQTGKTYHY